MKISILWKFIVFEIHIFFYYFRYYFRGFVPKEIIGTFKKGKLVGVGKVQLDNGQTLVADFKNGEMNGLIRVWDTQGNLTEMWYKNIFTRGRAWAVNENNLVWYPNNVIGKIHII